jgi:DNA-nicking Smr family endonuclease
MLGIDLHGMNEKDAITLVVQTYNRQVANGQRERINVVHGYGSTGKGGVLQYRLRDLLQTYGVDFLVGEWADGNPGHTILIPGDKIPEPKGKKVLRGGLGT